MWHRGRQGSKKKDREAAAKKDEEEAAEKENVEEEAAAAAKIKGEQLGRAVDSLTAKLQKDLALSRLVIYNVM